MQRKAEPLNAGEGSIVGVGTGRRSQQLSFSTEDDMSIGKFNKSAEPLLDGDD